MNTVFFTVVATSHIWLLSTQDVVSIANLAYVTQLHLNDHMWLVDTVLHSLVLDTAGPFPLNRVTGARELLQLNDPLDKIGKPRAEWI